MTAQAEGIFTICNRLGLHARSASKLVRLASSHEGAVFFEKDDQRVNGKSIMGVLLLCGESGASLRVIVQGDGAELMVQKFGELIGNRFGEAE